MARRSATRQHDQRSEQAPPRAFGGTTGREAIVSYLVRIPLEDGDSVTLETTDGPGSLGGSVTRSGRASEALEEVSGSLESYLGGIRSATAAMVSPLRSIDDGVEEVDIALGIKLSARAGLVIANTAGEANVNVTVRWRRRDPEPGHMISLPEATGASIDR